MFKILLLITLASISAYADTYNIVVTNDDHVDILVLILEGLNYFFGLENTVNTGALRYLSIVYFVLVIGTVWALVQLAMSAMAGQAAAGFKHYFMYIFMVFTIALLMYGPRSSVLVQTRDGSSYGTSTDIPTFFAFTLSMFTELRLELSDLTETAFNVPDPTDNFKSGGSGGFGYFGGELEMSKASISARFTNENNGSTIAPMYSAFIRDCVVLPSYAQVGGMSKMNGTLNSTSIKGNIAPTATGYANELVNFDGVTGSCGDFWSGATWGGSAFVNLQTLITNFENNISTSSSLGKLGSALAYFGAITENNTAINNAASVKAAATQAVLSNEFRSVFAKMGIAGEVASDGAAQTMANSQIEGISTGLYVAEQLPRAAFLLFALMISAVPFLFAFAMFPGSFAILLNFLKTLLWISLWEPMANILGLFQDFYFAKLLKENGYTTLNDIIAVTPDNIINISSEAAALAGMAGVMFVAIQGLSWMLITGSGQMIGNLMSSTGQTFQRYSNADAQLETRTDMKEAALMSKEMGRHVSLREKHAYAATMRAAGIAGKMTGFMKAHGTNNAGAGFSMTHTDSTNMAFQQANSIGGAEAVTEAYEKNGTLDTKEISKVASTNAGKKIGTELGVHNTLGNSTAAKDVHTELSAHKERINASIASDLDNMDAPEKTAVAELTASKSAAIPLKTLEKIQKDQGGSLDQVKDSVVNAEALKGAVSTTKILSESAGAKGDQSLIATEKTLSEVVGMQKLEDGKVLNNIGEKQNRQNAKYQAGKNVGGANKESLFNQEMINNVSKSLENVNKQLEAITKKLETAKAPTQKTDPAEIQKNIDHSHDENKQSFDSAPKSAENSQKFIKKDKELKEKQSALNDLGNKDNIKKGINALQEKREDAIKTLKKEQSSAKTPADRLKANQKFQKSFNEINQKSSALGKRLQAIEHLENEGTDIQNSKVAGLEEDLKTIQNEKVELETKRQALDVSNIGIDSGAEITNKLGKSTKSDGKAAFNAGIMDTEQKNSLQRKLDALNIPSEKAGKLIGEVQALAISGKINSAEISGQLIAQAYVSGGGVEGLSRISGISKETIQKVANGKGTTDENMQVAMASDATNELNRSFVTNGTTRQNTYKDDGGIGASTVSNKQTISTGTSIDYSPIKDIAAISMDTNTASDTEIKLRGVLGDTLKTLSSVASIKSVAKVFGKDKTPTETATKAFKGETVTKQKPANNVPNPKISGH